MHFLAVIIMYVYNIARQWAKGTRFSKYVISFKIYCSPV